MSKVATTYWDDSANAVFSPATAAAAVAAVTTGNTRSKTRAKIVKREKSSSQWLVFTVGVVLSSMICLTVNLRAYGELSQEIEQFRLLNTEVERLTTENSALQEEIQQIKTDSSVIEREARKLGMSRPNEKVLVPAN